MNIEFSQQEINNLLVLIAKAPITGNEALIVAMLQQKLTQSLPAPEKEVEKKK